MRLVSQTTADLKKGHSLACPFCDITCLQILLLAEPVRKISYPSVVASWPIAPGDQQAVFLFPIVLVIFHDQQAEEIEGFFIPFVWPCGDTILRDAVNLKLVFTMSTGITPAALCRYQSGGAPRGLSFQMSRAVYEQLTLWGFDLHM